MSSAREGGGHRPTLTQINTKEWKWRQAVPLSASPTIPYFPSHWSSSTAAKTVSLRFSSSQFQAPEENLRGNITEAVGKSRKSLTTEEFRHPSMSRERCLLSAPFQTLPLLEQCFRYCSSSFVYSQKLLFMDHFVKTSWGCSSGFFSGHKRYQCLVLSM